MTDQATTRKAQIAVMNAVHDLPVLVAREQGFFEDEGLDTEFVTTPGMAQVTTSHSVSWDSIFDRPLDSIYNEGGASRLLHAPPQPHTRERFDDTYNWAVKWDMVVPGATYENTVDNRAWE